MSQGNPAPAAIKDTALQAQPAQVRHQHSLPTAAHAQEFQCQLEVSGQGEHSIPAGWVRLHWAVDQANPGLGDGVAFGAEAFSWRNEQDQLLQPGWVGLGFSEEAPPSHPPQMINGTAIFGYFDANRAPQVLSWRL